SSILNIYQKRQLLNPYYYFSNDMYSVQVAKRGLKSQPLNHPLEVLYEGLWEYSKMKVIKNTYPILERGIIINSNCKIFTIIKSVKIYYNN
ncbi:MAG: hypothetical protein ACW98D_19185, partial [Promethearchaeota archaeon]